MSNSRSPAELVSYLNALNFALAEVAKAKNAGGYPSYVFRELRNSNQILAADAAAQALFATQLAALITPPAPPPPLITPPVAPDGGVIPEP